MRGLVVEVGEEGMRTGRGERGRRRREDAGGV